MLVSVLLLAGVNKILCILATYCITLGLVDNMEIVKSVDLHRGNIGD